MSAGGNYSIVLVAEEWMIVEWVLSGGGGCFDVLMFDFVRVGGWGGLGSGWLRGLGCCVWGLCVCGGCVWGGCPSLGASVTTSISSNTNSLDLFTQKRDGIGPDCHCVTPYQA